MIKLPSTILSYGTVPICSLAIACYSWTSTALLLLISGTSQLQTDSIPKPSLAQDTVAPPPSTARRLKDYHFSTPLSSRSLLFAILQINLPILTWQWKIGSHLTTWFSRLPLDRKRLNVASLSATLYYTLVNSAGHSIQCLFPSIPQTPIECPNIQDLANLYLSNCQIPLKYKQHGQYPKLSWTCTHAIFHTDTLANVFQARQQYPSQHFRSNGFFRLYVCNYLWSFSMQPFVLRSCLYGLPCSMLTLNFSSHPVQLFHFPVLRIPARIAVCSLISSL